MSKTFLCPSPILYRPNTPIISAFLIAHINGISEHPLLTGWKFEFGSVMVTELSSVTPLA